MEDVNPAPVYALNLFDVADLHPHREAGGGNYVWHPA